MKYVSEDSKEPLPSPHNGFWVKDHTIYDVSESSHILFLVEHPAFFSLTLDQIKEVYKTFAEPFGSDGGRAREHLIRLTVRSRAIRVRKYEHPSYFSIQCNSTVNQRADIVAFIRWAIEMNVMKADDAAVILGFQDESDRYSYTWEEGGIGKYVESTDLGNS
jgi:hypothetical protein